MPALAQGLNAELVRRFGGPAFQQIYFVRGEEKPQVDLVRDMDIQLGKHQIFGRGIVDALENIGAKITAIFGRLERKDFVDLYFLLHREYKWGDLLALAKQKDSGLNEFFLAGMMRQVAALKQLPVTLKPIDLETLKAFYLDLAYKPMRNAKPL